MTASQRLTIHDRPGHRLATGRAVVHGLDDAWDSVAAFGAGLVATRSRRTADRRRRGQSLAERRTGTAALLSAVLLVVVGTVVGVVGAAVLLGLAQHLGLELPEGSAGQGGLLVQLAGRISP